MNGCPATSIRQNGNAEHTDLMNRLIEELEELGCELFIERQNSFRVESASSGMGREWQA